MRPAQNKRMRGRNNNNNNNNNRRGPNPLTRSYESNGPDVKVRGTAAHIAEKYVQLARDAHVSGDPVAAESYLQHAEHYFRLIAAAQLAQNPPPRNFDGSQLADAPQSDEGEDEDFDGGVNDRFTYRAPQSYQAPSQTQPFATEQGAQEFSVGEPGADQPDVEQPYGERQEPRNHEGRNGNGNRYDNRNQNRFDNRRDNRNGPPRNEFQRDARDNRNQEPRNQEPRPQDRFDGPRRDRPVRPERVEPPRFDQPRQERSFEPRPERFQRVAPPEVAAVQPILPSFITAPVRPTNAVEVEIKDRSAPVERPGPVEEQAEAVVRAPRRRRRVVSAHDEGEDKGTPVDTPAAE